MSMKTDLSKIETILTWKIPTSIKEVRSFLRIWRLLSKVASKHFPDSHGPRWPPDRHILKPVNYKEEVYMGWCTTACFDTLVHKLATATVLLAYADYSKLFKLHTNASSHGFGAGLYQEHDGVDRVKRRIIMQVSLHFLLFFNE